MDENSIKIIKIYRENANEEHAKKMSAYMKNHFAFYGISKPRRAELSKEFLKEKVKNKVIDWDFVFTFFDLPEREFQYLALEYLAKLKKHLQKQDLDKLANLIVRKSWWDSVDAIAPLVGELCMRYPELKEEAVVDFITDENIWLKRVSIIFQLKYKDKVDTEFLTRAILANHLSKEFFVNKAIGWALRQYSKFNPNWVRHFISNHSLAPLSVREGSKYL